MVLLSDFHTHADFVDGESSVKDMVNSAYMKGLFAFGLSEHLYSEKNDWGTKDNQLNEYLSQLNNMKRQYAGKMEVLCGLEVENADGGAVLTDEQKNNIDYYIRSTHVLETDGIVFDVDNTAEILTKMVEEHYSGDWYALVRHYYEEESKINEAVPYSFIGHFDLITKFNQDDRLFRTDCDDYIQPALEAMDKLLTYDMPFEVNSGAISRGYRKEPYPSNFLLRELCQRGGRIIINSDAHHCDNICFGYEKAMKLSYESGFRKVCVLAENGMSEMNIP